MNLDETNAVLSNWGMIGTSLLQRYDVGGDRLVLKVDTNLGEVILKGQPVKNSEEAMLDIVAAHEFLGNKHGMAPKIFYCLDGALFWKDGRYYYYVMEFIFGRAPSDTIKDWRLLGCALAQLHNLRGYDRPVAFDVNDDIKSFYELYKHKPWKEEFDSLVNALPDFNKYKQCLIHADIGQSNCIIRDDGFIMFIDLDGVGIGSQYVCLGVPIINFVHRNNQKGGMEYRYDLANAFLNGYCSIHKLNGFEYDLMWHGAVFSYVYNMQWFDDDEVDIRWSKLKFGLEQKDL